MGIADGPVTAVPEIEMRQVSIKETTLKSLKKVTALLNLATTGRKDVLFSHIQDSPHVKKLSMDEFEYRHTILSSKKIPKWVILTPEEVPLVDAGIDMGTGHTRRERTYKQGECCLWQAVKFYDGAGESQSTDVWTKEAGEEEEEEGD